jgi:hypothetical protein
MHVAFRQCCWRLKITLAQLMLRNYFNTKSLIADTTLNTTQLSMNRLRTLMALCFFILANTSCEHGIFYRCSHMGATVANHSDSVLYCRTLFANLGLAGTDPRSLGKIALNDSEVFRIDPGGKNDEEFRLLNDCINDYLSSDTTNALTIWFFDAATLKNIPWDTIVARNLYLKTVTFNLRQIQAVNWLLQYP